MWDQIDRDEKIRLIRYYVSYGYSSTKIAQAIGGCTRNSVIGLAHRAKISLSGNPSDTMRYKTSEKPKALRMPKPLRTAPRQRRAEVAPDHPEPVLQAPQPSVEPVKFEEDSVLAFLTGTVGVTLLQLNEYTCKWPIGDPLEVGFHFCGQHSMETGPYCETHARKAFHTPENGRSNFVGRF